MIRPMSHARLMRLSTDRVEEALKDGDSSFGFIIAQSQELTVRQDARFSLGVATRR